MDYAHVLEEALKTLGSWFLVFIAYHVAYIFTEQMRSESKFWNIRLWNSRAGMFVAYPFFLFWVAVVALIFWAGYGTHTEDDDPLRGGGGEVVVDFEPTKKERNEYGLKMFLTLSAPAMVAVYRQYKKNPLLKEPINVPQKDIRR